jgi:hypothetical protein
MDEPIRRTSLLRRWLRFSLRELLLLMIAVAAVLGWLRSLHRDYGPFAPTPFADCMFTQLASDYREVAEHVGEPQSPSSVRFLGGGGGGFSSRWLHRHMWCELRDAEILGFQYWHRDQRGSLHIHLIRKNDQSVYLLAIGDEPST